MTTKDKGIPWLDLDDVAQILGEERERGRQRRAGIPEELIDVRGARPLAKLSVQTYAYRMRNPGNVRQFGDMVAEGRVFPPPTYPSGGNVPMPGEHPRWPVRAGETREDVENRFRVWYHLRKGAGVGGGRRPKAQPPPPAPVPDDQQPAAHRTRRRKGPRRDV